MRKRLTALLLALVMCLSLVPTVAFAGEHDNQVRVIVENTTYAKSAGAPWEGTLVDEWVNITDDSTMMSCVVAALTAKGYTQEGAEANYISEINGLAEFNGGAMSGWMGTLNDWFANEGFAAFTVKDGKLSAGDEIRMMYSLNYGEDCGGSWSNNDKTVKSVTFSAGTLNTTFDKNTHDYTLTIPAGTTAVTVTPTASNKNYQVHTYVGTAEYKRTAAVPVENGTVITVKCGDPAWPSMNTTTDEARVYTFTVNRPLPAESISLNKKELTLNKGDKETLTAAVTPDGATDEVTWSSSAEAVATVTNGVVTAVSAGTATITATAGTKSDTCAVTVTDWKTVTVNVAPKTVNVTFYSDAAGTKAVSTDMVKDNGEKKVGNYTYHQYTLLLPDDLKDGGVYSYRGTEGAVSLGGEEFKPADYLTAPLHLLRANVRYNAASLNQEGDYTFTLKNGEKEVVYGTPYVSSNIRYTPTLLIAGVKHSGTAALAQQWQEDYYLSSAGAFSNTPSKTTTSASNINLPIAAYKKISLTAPKDAAVTFYKQEANYVVQSVTPDSVETAGDTTTYLFKGTAAHSNYQYRAMLAGKVTQAGYLKDDDCLTVTFPDRAATDTASTLAYDDNGVLLNIDDSKDTNELALTVGETFKLRAYRAAWQVVNSVTANQMIEPDFHYAVLSGSDVISVTPTTESAKGAAYCSGNAGGNWMNVTALKEGTAILAVWYDALDVYGANPSNATGITTFGATDPARYGYVVVNVGTDSTVAITPASADGDWDAEFDTVYYTGDNGTFSFTSDTATAVTVRNLCGTVMGEAKSVTKTADGKWNVPVVTGSNLLTITSEAGTDYRMIRATRVTVTYTDVTTGESADDISRLEISKGDTIQIHYNGLHMPIPKMSGIYNPGYTGTAKVAYRLDDQYTVLSAGTQYDFASSEKSDIVFKVPSAGEHTLEGYISLSSMGDDFGNHRNTPDTGHAANMNASEKFGTFGSLPGITFTAKDSTGGITYEEATALKSVAIYVGGSNAYYTAAKFTAVKDYQETTWSNSGTNAMSVTVTPNSFYNSIKLRYWYEGEDAVELPLTGGVGTVINTFQRQTSKLLTIEVLVAPGDASLGKAKAYTFVVMSTTDKNAITKAFNAINAIGTVTADSGAKITAARSTYDALKDVLKAKVTNYAVLTAAESAYANIVRTKARDIYTAVGNSLLENAEKSTPVVNSIGGEWMILGLARSGKLTDDVAAKYYANVLETVKQAKGVLDSRKYTEYSRVVLALTAAGYDPTDVAGYDLTAPLTDFGKTVWQGNNGAVFGLIALNSHGYHSDNTAICQQYVNELLSKQLENGGWYITSGNADPDMTAMAIQALAPYYTTTNAAVKTAVDKALDFLSEQQGANGDYGSSETCAQVVVALSALGIDAAADSRFVKNGTSVLEALCSYYAEDAAYGKGFAHVKENSGSYVGGAYNGMATEQCYYALTAYERFKAAQNTLYNMSDVTHLHSFATTLSSDASGHWYACKDAACAVTLDKKSHTPVADAAVASTCTETGLTAGSHCADCSYVITARESTEKKAHTYDNGKVTKAATCTADGVMTFTCTKCGATKTETINAAGHNYTDATCTAPKTCRNCGLTEGTARPHSYGANDICSACGTKNPLAKIDATKVAAVDSSKVSPANAGKIIADDSGLVIKATDSVDQAKLDEIKAALTTGSTAVKSDPANTVEIPATSDGKNELGALASNPALTNEQKAEVSELAAAFDQMQNDSARKAEKVEMVLDLSVALKGENGAEVAELTVLPNPVTVRIPISDDIYAGLQGKSIVILRSHTDVLGKTVVKELTAKLGGTGGSCYVEFESDQFSTFALVSYETVSHGSGHSSTAPTKSFATDLSGITAVYVDGVKLDSKYYTVSGTTVTLSESFLKTLKDGKHTFKAENATHIATGTFRTSCGSAVSPRTADSGIALYAAMSVMSLMGMGWVGRKRRSQ